MQFLYGFTQTLRIWVFYHAVPSLTLKTPEVWLAAGVLVLIMELSLEWIHHGLQMLSGRSWVDSIIAGPGWVLCCHGFPANSCFQDSLCMAWQKAAIPLDGNPDTTLDLHMHLMYVTQSSVVLKNSW